MKNKKPVIDFSLWDEIQVRRHSDKTSPNELGITISLTPNKKEKKVFLSIGKNICKKLKWESNDLICFYSNPKDYLEIAAVKRKVGYKLKNPPKRDTMSVAFKFNKINNLKTHSLKIVPHEIHDLGYLVFNLNTEGI